MITVKNRPPDELIARTGVFLEWDEVGSKYISYLEKYCGLNPNSDIFDLGSGPGRVELMCREQWGEDRRGHYYAHEIDKEHTDWMSENIPGATIIHADIFNRRYNPTGKIDPVTYRFPIDDSSCDIAVLLSVFTHMFEPEIRNYTSEIHRILRPGGKALITCFIRENSGNESMKIWEKSLFEEMMKPLEVVEFVKGDWERGLAVHYDQDFYILAKV